MKILFTSSECTPFARTGGLGDVIGSLPKALNEHKNIIIIPFYSKKSKNLTSKKYNIRTVIKNLRVHFGPQVESFSVKKIFLSKTTPVYFIENPHYFGRDEIYGPADAEYFDNAQRFTFFCKAVLETTKALGFQPDIIHANDWQTGLIPALLKTTYLADGFFHKTRSVFTIHNMDYQGIYPPFVIPLAGIGWDAFDPGKMEFFGNVNLLKTGIVYADAVITVSKQYAKEILSPEYGRGLEGVVKARKKMLSGIVNGIDYEKWNPENDKNIKQKFSSNNLKGKEICKLELQKKCKFPHIPDVPLIVIVSRLTPQKGFDLIRNVFHEMMQMPLQFVLLGVGNREYMEFFADMAQLFPEKFSAHLDFADGLSHSIYAGADMFLMPSHIEPCGLSQLISFHYGVVPIVTQTGGLVDTVKPFNQKTGKGSGFVLKDYSSKSLIHALDRAIKTYHNKKIWTSLVKRIMKLDFSWKKSAKEYNVVYKKVVKG